MKQNLHIIEELMKLKPENDEELSRAKRKLSRDFKISLPTNNWLLKTYRQLVKVNKIKKSEILEYTLVKRRVRTLSGVAPVTLATKPFPCPGRCVYCPTDVRMPKSYLPSQPAAARALRLKFHPYDQVQGRLQAFYENGHIPEKADMRILGGTWSSYKKPYQTWFIREMYRGLNEFEPKTDRKKNYHIHSRPRGNDKKLETLQKQNETAIYRCIGLSIETRPDWVTMDEIKRFRRFGVTKVELGVQHLDNKVQDLTKRDHYKEDVVNATKILKDAGFKVAYHVMPNLPGSTPKMDLEMYKEIFENQNLRPDQMKIYPCVVLKQAYLYKWFQEGKFKTYDDETLTILLAKMKAATPRYVRIERINRDVPSHDIVDGTKNINIREFTKQYMKKYGQECLCIRCREVGKKQYKPQSIEFYQHKYEASDGTEYFLSYESSNLKTLHAFMRLRFPSKDTRNILKPLRNTAIIRELHTYGQLAPLTHEQEHDAHFSQHKGLGKKLLRKAEQIAKSHNYDNIAVISGVGVRGYYKKNGYELEEKLGYMVKKI